MQNLLLLHCRQSQRLSITGLAKATGIPGERYRQLESGDELMTPHEARLLAGVLKARARLLRCSSAQVTSYNNAEILLGQYRQRFKELKTRLHATP